MTLVAYQHQCLFGKIVDEEMVLSPTGKMIREEWFASARIRKEIRLDAKDFVVMPNHIHGVVQIIESVGADGVRPSDTKGASFAPLQRKPRSLSSFIAGFKSSATKRATEIDKTIVGSIWQRNYYEHIIRDENEWARIRVYIETNPINWTHDDENLDG